MGRDGRKEHISKNYKKLSIQYRNSEGRICGMEEILIPTGDKNFETYMEYRRKLWNKKHFGAEKADKVEICVKTKKQVNKPVITQLTFDF